MANTIEKKRPLATNPFNLCKVDIIIPFHGEYNALSRLVESIWRNTWTNVYNLILVDDASPNAKFIQNLKGVHNIQAIRMEQQSGFAASVNAGIAASKENYVCIMHSDVEVTHPHWLSSMGETLLKLRDKGVKLVGSRSNNPLSDCPGLKAAKLEHVEDTIVEEPLPLYCAIAHRQLFKHTGNLKEYPYAWYEDEYLFWKMKKLGFKQAISGKSWVKHEGQLTINSIWQAKPEVRDIMESSREQCVNDIKLIFG